MGGSSLGAVSILVPDYDSAIRFYCDDLGFVLTDDIDQGHKRWVTVTPPGGGAKIVLARAETEREKATIGRQGGGRVWLFLHTDDFNRDYRRMQAAAVVFEEEPRDETYGRVAVWRDPFGNRWDLIGPKPQR
jgi:catechol 2,3-dioxygenase-like lactoylglutathione lyase family enzyme